MWKFQTFSIVLILREINFGESKSSETAVFPSFLVFSDLEKRTEKGAFLTKTLFFLVGIYWMEKIEEKGEIAKMKSKYGQNYCQSDFNIA